MSIIIAIVNNITVLVSHIIFFGPFKPMSHGRAYSRNLGQRSILARKGTFYENSKNFTPPYSIPFLSVYIKIKLCIIFTNGGSVQ